MKVGDVVVWDAYGHHRAVVLAVAPTGHAIIACSHVVRDMPCVTVLPRTLGSRSLGWSDTDNRTSHFYPSGLHAVTLNEIRPLHLPGRGTSTPQVRRVNPRVLVELQATVARWVREGVVTVESVCALLPRDDGPKEP